MSSTIDIAQNTGSEPPQNNRISRIVQFSLGLSLYVIVIYLICGTFGYLVHNPGYNNPKKSFNGTFSNNTLIDGMYFTVVTLTTVGYGDLFPSTFGSMCFTMALAFLGSTLNSALFLCVDSLLEKIVKRRRSPRLVLACGVIAVVGFFAIRFLEREQIGWFDAIYLTVISLTTVGYGDKSFKTQGGRAFASVWLFFGTRTMIHFNNDVHSFILEKLGKVPISVTGEDPVPQQGFLDRNRTVLSLPLQQVVDLSFKLLIIGYSRTRKTTFLKRFCAHEFNHEYYPTLGVQVHEIEIETTSGKIKFNCLDTPGTKKLGEVGDDSYRDVNGAIIMFDLNNPVTYKNVLEWHKDLCKVCKDIPIVLCGNKVDVKNTRKATDIDLNLKLQYYEISGKSLHNMNQPLYYLARELACNENLHFVSHHLRSSLASQPQPGQPAANLASQPQSSQPAANLASQPQSGPLPPTTLQERELVEED